MTKSILLRGGVLFFAAVSPAFVCAQFQPPNPDELKMTADPKAPGAAAVYLDIKEIDKRSAALRELLRAHQSTHRKGQGAGDGRTSLPAGQLEDHRHQGPHHPSRRNHHSADRQAGRPADCEERRPADPTKRSSRCPASKSAASWSITTRFITTTISTHRRTGEIQRSLFCAQGALRVHASRPILPTARYDQHVPGRAWHQSQSALVAAAASGHRGAESAVNGRFSVDMTDIPPIPDEEWMPPIESLLYQGAFLLQPRAIANRLLARRSQALVKGCGQICRALEDHPGCGERVDCSRQTAIWTRRRSSTTRCRRSTTPITRAQKSASEMKELKIKADQACQRHLGAEERVERGHRHALPGHAARRGIDSLRGQGGRPRPEHLRSQRT